MGDYGRAVPQSEHGFPDTELLNGGDYGRHRGVSRQRVMSNFQQKLINRYLNSKGQPTYHAATCDAQWTEQSDPSTISIPTRGQRSRGMDGHDAMEQAGDFEPMPEVVPGNPGAIAMPDPGKSAKPEDKTKNIYSKVRNKGALHKAQIDEVKYHNLVGNLVDRAGVGYAIQELASMTRDRVMGVSDFIIDELFEFAEQTEEPYEVRKMKARLKLRKELESALQSVANDSVEGAISAVTE